MKSHDADPTSTPSAELCSRVAGDTVLQTLLDEAVASVQAGEGSLLMLVSGGSALRFVVSCSPSSEKLLGQEVPLTGSITGLAVSLQQPMIVNDVRRSDSFYPGTDARSGTTTESILVVPLSTPECEYGAITAINSKSQAGFAAAELEIYERVAGRICERLAALEAGTTDAGDPG